VTFLSCVRSIREGSTLVVRCNRGSPGGETMARIVGKQGFLRARVTPGQIWLLKATAPVELWRGVTSAPMVIVKPPH
jgi:hypothetical protein